MFFIRIGERKILPGYHSQLNRFTYFFIGLSFPTRPFWLFVLCICYHFVSKNVDQTLGESTCPCAVCTPSLLCAYDLYMSSVHICSQMVLGLSHWNTQLQLCQNKVHTVPKIFWDPAYAIARDLWPNVFRALTLRHHTVSKIFWAPANGHSSWFILFLYDSNSWKLKWALHAAFIYATAKKEV